MRIASIFVLWAMSLALMSQTRIRTSQIQDLDVVRLDAKRLAVGRGCSILAPCTVRFGSVSVSITAGATLTLGLGTGSVAIYADRDGLRAAHDLVTLTCAGCASVPAEPVFPSGSIPIARWSATAGRWDPEGADFRAFQSAPRPILAGPGLVAVESGGQSVVSIDRSSVGMRTGIPNSSSSPCVAGSWAADDSFFYVCHQSNYWRRVAIRGW